MPTLNRRSMHRAVTGAAAIALLSGCMTARLEEDPPEALPDITVDGTMSLFFNGEEIRIRALPGRTHGAFGAVP